MDDPACTVECAQIEDIPAMLSLEKRYFDTCWHSEPTFIHKLIKQEPMMFRVCKIDNEFKGYYWVIPLEYSIWKQILTGEISENAIMDHFRSFDEPNIYLYICSVIVELADDQHKKYTRALVHDFARNFVFRKTEDAPDIKAIGAFTISKGGRNLMERYDFPYNGSFKAGGKPVRSYAIKRQTLAQQAIARQKQKSIA